MNFYKILIRDIQNLMRVKMWISCAFHMSRNTIILLIYFQPFKNAKTILNLEAIQKKKAEEGGAVVWWPLL